MELKKNGLLQKYMRKVMPFMQAAKVWIDGAMQQQSKAFLLVLRK